jgi:hypothetical protein
MRWHSEFSSNLLLQQKNLVTKFFFTSVFDQQVQLEAFLQDNQQQNFEREHV